MKKRVFKKTYPIQYIYPNDTDTYQYTEDTYIIFEGMLDGVKICFYSRVQSVLRKTTDGGKTYVDTYDNLLVPSYFTALDVDFDEIIENVIPSNDGMVKEITEKL